MKDWQFIKLNLKELNRMIFWESTLIMLGTFTLCIIFFRAWGILIALIIVKALTVGGGNFIGTYPDPIRGKRDFPHCHCKKCSRWWNKII
jgi:hypothetical protein